MSQEIEKLAKELHDFYEERSIVNNWNTQKSCKVSFDALPKENKQTMLDLASLVQSKLSELEKEIKNKNKYIETLERAFSEVDLEYYKSLYEQNK